jgi:hypothetical protein
MHSKCNAQVLGEIISLEVLKTPSVSFSMQLSPCGETNCRLDGQLNGFVVMFTRSHFCTLSFVWCPPHISHPFPLRFIVIAVTLLRMSPVYLHFRSSDWNCPCISHPWHVCYSFRPSPWCGRPNIWRSSSLRNFLQLSAALSFVDQIILPSAPLSTPHILPSLVSAGDPSSVETSSGTWI